jgi:hypothetical protein
MLAETFLIKSSSAPTPHQFSLKILNLILKFPIFPLFQILLSVLKVQTLKISWPNIFINRVLMEPRISLVILISPRLKLAPVQGISCPSE